MHSADEAHAYLSEVKLLMQFCDVSTCDMEKGHLRCDANVSVRLKGVEELGVKAEVKNLNSFRFLKLAIDYEIARQIEIVDGGGRVKQETRSFNPDTGETVSMRSKETANDYRYFPEPDLLPLRIGPEWMSEIRRSMPELPPVKRERFIAVFGLREYDAQVLTQSRELSEYFERVVKAANGEGRLSANWVTGDLAGALKADGKEIGESPVSAERLGELVKLIVSGEISGKLAKEIFAKMWTTGGTAAAIMDREGLRQISDSGALDKIVDEVIAANPKQVEQYKSGKTTVAGFLVGQIMKASRGQANPQMVQDLLKAKLG